MKAKACLRPTRRLQSYDKHDKRIPEEGHFQGCKASWDCLVPCWGQIKDGHCSSLLRLYYNEQEKTVANKDPVAGFKGIMALGF